MSEENRNEIHSNDKFMKQIDRIWMIYMAIFLCGVFIEKKLFDQAFPNETSYIYVILIWFVAILLLYYGAKRVDTRIIKTILVICSVFVAIFWLHYAASLPKSDLDSTECTQWDCRLLYELATGTMADTWITTIFGQMFLILTQFTIIPTLLMVLYQSNPNQETRKFDPKSMVWLAGITFGIGLIEYLLPSYLAILMVSFITLLMVLFMSHLDLSKNLQEKSKEEKSEYISINFEYFLQNLMALAAITIFVFSFTEINGYPLEMIWQMGIGVLILYLSITVIISKVSDEINTLVWWLDVLFFSVILVSMAMGWNYYYSPSSLQTLSGISPFISGILFGYFAIRLNIYIRNPNPPQTRALPLKFLKKPIGDWFLLNLMILLVFVGSLFEIIPRNTDAFVAFVPGLIVGLIGWLLAAFRKYP